MNIKNNSLVCYTGVIDGDVLYTFNNMLSLIMKYDLRDFTYEVIGQLQGHMIYRNSVIRMLLYEENIYLIMFRWQHIVRFNIANRNITEYSLRDDVLKPNELIWGAFMYKFWIWEFSVCSGCKIYAFSCQTGENKIYCSIKELFEKKNVTIGSDDFFSNMFQISNQIWAAVCGTPYLFCFNFDEIDITIFKIKCKSINSLDYDGKNFWITISDSTRIINWSPDYGNIDCFNVDEINFRDYTSCYVCGTDDRIFIIPNADKDFCSINRKTKQYEFLPVVGNYQELSLNKDVLPFGGYLRTIDSLILLPRNIDKIVVIDLKNGIVSCKDGQLLKIDYENLYVKQGLQTGGIEENRNYTLIDYISYLSKYILDLRRKKIGKNIGKEIYIKM